MTAIELLKRTTEYEVLESFRNKVAELEEQEKNKYSVDDLQSAWNSSEQNMRFKFSSSAYKNVSFKKWLENFKKK